MTVKLERAGKVAVVTIDNPPVNAMSRAIRQRIVELVAELDADPGIDRVLLTGAGRIFMGGADISEFDLPLAEPWLPDMIARVETAQKPWIGLANGAALGGGVELLAGCRLRLAVPEARFSLPEINIGLIPGAGGTQRLARLIGVEAAVDVVAANRVLGAAEALELGYIDHLVTGPLPEAAIALVAALDLAQLPDPSPARVLQSPSAEGWELLAAKIDKSARGAAAPPLALEALRVGATRGFAAGIAHEREIFLRLRESTESRAMRYLFFAERAAPRPADLRAIPPRDLTRAGVVGGGTMGAGIAAALVNAGLEVVLSERDQPSLERGLAALRGIFEAAAKRGLTSTAEAERRFASVSGTIGTEGLGGCDLVVEAVFEDLAVKQAVFAALARDCRSDAILATNTSYIDPARIYAGLPGPERFLGLHFFSPAQVMKLLEVVPVPQTGPETLASIFGLARRMGKIPVRSGICEGFIGNRILKRYRAEMDLMLAEGVHYADIDDAMRSFGFAMGPFEMQDLTGLDIAYMNREAARASGALVPEVAADLLVRAGRIGQKAGAGWYDYAPGSRSLQPSAAAEAIVAPLTGPRRPADTAATIARLTGVMADEGQRILDEGIAARPEDIDLVEVHGFGFPRKHGGPMFLARSRADKE